MRNSKPRSAALSLGLRSLLAVVVAAAYVIAIGYLNIHAKTIVTGAALDWRASVVSVTSPAPPLLPAAGVALLTAGVFVLAWRSRVAARGSRQLLPVWLATVTLIVLSSYAMASTAFPFSALASTFGSDVDPMPGWASPEPVALALGREGALSPATHALTGVMVVLSLMRSNLLTRRSGGERGSPHDAASAGDSRGNAAADTPSA
ncbi:hypothetical protein MWU57_05540 [Isoptericola sp. S6320L]|nr:hypothetical protein [Isoptericola sp. S6320L]